MATNTTTPTAIPPRLWTFQFAGLAFRVNLRTLTFTLLALALLLALSCLAMMLGSFRLSVGEVVSTLLGNGEGRSDFIIWRLRFPRTLTLVMLGAALAMSGAIFQGAVRNPLVSPDIIGINAGATLAAVFWILTEQDQWALPLVAFGGAVSIAALIYALTWRGHISGGRLILVGIGVNALLTAGTTFLFVRYPVQQVRDALAWTVGSVNNSNWSDVQLLAFSLAVLIPVGLALMWSLRVMQLGDIPARTVGMPLERTRLALIVVGSGLCALAVTVAGPIGFVALTTPHVARMVAGPMTGGVFMFAAIIGGIFLMTSDIIAQHALPVALPVGVVTAAVGAPYFLFLLYRTNTRI